MNIRSFERREYAASLAEMRYFSASRNDTTEDEIWLVEHESVFTLGLASKAEHLLSPGDIPCVQTERGGQVTYHGPGQVVAYLMLDLRRSGMMVRDLVCKMESAVIDTLAVWGVCGVRKVGAPGVYVERPRALAKHEEINESERSHSDFFKIAALGIKVSKGRTFHGLALNVDMDLQPFKRINPCGFPGLEVTDLKNCRQWLASVAKQADLVSIKSECLHSDSTRPIIRSVDSTSELRLCEVAETLGALLNRHLTSPLKEAGAMHG
jgi:lipoyl(octanoyl) transferase